MILDLNLDGYLTGKEIAFTKNDGKWMNEMKKVDKNNDKEISEVELYSYLREDIQKLPFSSELGGQKDGPDEIVSKLFNNKDADKDGFITFEEFKNENEEL